jgi:hypothetical protein
MSKEQQTAHSAHSKAGRLTSTATRQATGYRTKNRYDAVGRRTRTEVISSAGTLFWVTNGYDSASRLQVVSDGTRSATYNYLVHPRSSCLEL